MTFCMNIMPF